MFLNIAEITAGTDSKEELMILTVHQILIQPMMPVVPLELQVIMY